MVSCLGIQREAQATGYFHQLHERLDSVREDDMIYEYVVLQLFVTLQKLMFYDVR